MRVRKQRHKLQWIHFRRSYIPVASRVPTTTTAVRGPAAFSSRCRTARGPRKGPIFPRTGGSVNTSAVPGTRAKKVARSTLRVSRLQSKSTAVVVVDQTADDLDSRLIPPFSFKARCLPHTGTRYHAMIRAPGTRESRPKNRNKAWKRLPFCLFCCELRTNPGVTKTYLSYQR